MDLIFFSLLESVVAVDRFYLLLYSPILKRTTTRKQKQTERHTRLTTKTRNSDLTAKYCSRSSININLHRNWPGV